MRKLLILTGVAFFTLHAIAQDIPEAPVPARLVNDFAKVMTDEQVASLEYTLDTFARSTTTQICIVTIPSLNGYDIADYTFKLGEKWGVGQKDSNNGVVIVFKPKTERESGEVFVAVGYGLEGVIPDAVANRLIVNNEMIPHFRENDTYGGLLAGCKVIMSLASSEFTAQDYEEKVSGDGHYTAFIIFVIVFFILFFFVNIGNRKNHDYTIDNKSKGLMYWLLMSIFNSGSGSGRSSGSGGSWGNFSGGNFGGGGGFGGGGFGGFGGGSFGGGGAGGRW